MSLGLSVLAISDIVSNCTKYLELFNDTATDVVHPNDCTKFFHWGGTCNLTVEDCDEGQYANPDGCISEKPECVPDPCDPNPCQLGGTCVPSGDNYTCDCPVKCPCTLTGDNCEYIGMYEQNWCPLTFLL